MARFMRDRYYPAVASLATGFRPVPVRLRINDTEFAGGVFGNARVTASKYLDVAVQAMGGDGVGTLWIGAAGRRDRASERDA